MNVLTQIRNQNKINELEIKLNSTSGSKSWHHKYNHSPWIYVGGLAYELNEGDVKCVFSQYGEVSEIHLIRHKKTGKSKGFCFLSYEDQRSTILAVDNFNGIKICNRIIRVDHVDKFTPPEDLSDDEVEESKDLTRRTINDSKYKRQSDRRISDKRYEQSRRYRDSKRPRHHSSSRRRDLSR